MSELLKTTLWKKDNTIEGVKKKSNSNLLSNIWLTANIELESITFKQALQEYHRHKEAYVRYWDFWRLNTAMIYFNAIIKKNQDGDQNRILSEENKKLENFLLKNDLYKDLGFDRLEDLKDMSIQFHFALNEFDRCFKWWKVDEASNFLQDMIKEAKSDKEKEILKIYTKTN